MLSLAWFSVLNIAVFLIIGKTSALTMNVSGVIKDWLIILSSMWIFKSILTKLNTIGFTIAFTGVILYNYMRRRLKEQQEQEEKKYSKLPQ